MLIFHKAEFYLNIDTDTLIDFTEKNLLNNLNKVKNLIQKLEHSTNTKLNHIFLTKQMDKDLLLAESLLSSVSSSIPNDGKNNMNKDQSMDTINSFYEKTKKIAELKLKINAEYLKEFRKDINIVIGNPEPSIPKEKNDRNNSNYGINNILKPGKILNDIETMSIGELCFAALYTPGVADDQYSFVITQVNDTSTKIPFLFPGEVLTIGSFGIPYINKPENIKNLYQSLKMFLSLPNDTLIYPRKNLTLQNLEICAKIDQENEFVKEKLKWVSDLANKSENAVGSRLIEEKFYNPVYRMDDEVYSKILGEGFYTAKKFENLVKLKDLIVKQIESNKNNNPKKSN